MALTENTDPDLYARQATPAPTAWSGKLTPDTVMEQLLAAVAAALEVNNPPHSRVGRSLQNLHADLTAPSGSIARGGLAPWQIRKVDDLISAGIARPISTSQLAVEISLSPRHFARAFKTSMGHTPGRHIMLCRIERAKALMLESRDPLCQISLACGFNDQAHLSRMFRRHVGRSPGFWRRQTWARYPHDLPGAPITEMAS